MDAGICPICLKERTLEVHHIIPRSSRKVPKVVREDPRNLIGICRACHAECFPSTASLTEEEKNRELTALYLVMIIQSKRYGAGWWIWNERMLKGGEITRCMRNAKIPIWVSQERLYMFLNRLAYAYMSVEEEIRARFQSGEPLFPWLISRLFPPRAIDFRKIDQTAIEKQRMEQLYGPPEWKTPLGPGGQQRGTRTGTTTESITPFL